ncbi:MAG: class I SAM-dependent methyltransferase [Verrucomicrobiota bacterium]|nr:class I SAM-dependent methyltransferase [Verrucomicrobiota bacterium]
MTTTASIDHAKLEAFMGQAVADMGAAMNAALVLLGDQLGLYKAMVDAGPLTPRDLALKTGTRERYIREWLCAQAAGGYVDYNAADGTYTLPPEQALALAIEDSPCFIAGAYQIVSSVIRDEPKVRGAFKSGRGVAWHERCQELFDGTERFFRANYATHLVASWIPALEGVEEKLRRGATVADVGCGHGASTLLMAQAFPNSRFIGFDYHDASIDRATRAAQAAGLGERVSFAVAGAREYPGTDYDLVACFDCLHDMGDPVGAAGHVRESLRSDGTWMIVEPFAQDRVEQNLNPVGRVYYSASTMICTPASLSQEVGLALGAQAGEQRLREVATQGGFTRFRRAAETPFNLVLEARP